MEIFSKHLEQKKYLALDGNHEIIRKVPTTTLVFFFWFLFLGLSK